MTIIVATSQDNEFVFFTRYFATLRALWMQTQAHWEILAHLGNLKNFKILHLWAAYIQIDAENKKL